MAKVIKSRRAVPRRASVVQKLIAMGCNPGRVNAAQSVGIRALAREVLQVSYSEYRAAGGKL